LKCFYDLKKEWWIEGGEVKLVAVVVRLVRRGGKDGMFLKGDTYPACYDFTSPLFFVRLIYIIFFTTSIFDNLTLFGDPHTTPLLTIVNTFRVFKYFVQIVFFFNFFYLF